MEVRNRTALVTGANRGIGRAIAHALEREGAQVLAGVRTPDADHDVGPTANLRAVRIDLSSRASVEESVRALGDVRIDILVNNAGQFAGGLFEDHDVGRIYELVQSSFTGPIHLTRLLLPGMLERGSGKIVNNDSIIGHAPFPGASVYAGIKTGLHGFTESLRRELDHTALTVLELVTPGLDTEMMTQVQEQLDPYVDTSGWDHVDPEDWAGEVVAAIGSDAEECKPGGVERLAKLLPKALLDLGTRHAFDRSGR
jgi:3-hydroxy acid dehydrogenase/malonic semialdehyde reductase